MLKNYFKIAIRNLLKHKIYTIINALGLSLGMASCLFLLIISQYEISFDNYHENRDRIYRLTDRVRVAENNEIHTAASPAPWGPALQKQNPEIESCVRWALQEHSFRQNENLISELVVYSDPTVFDIFTYPLLKGNATTALRDPYSLVLTTEMAKKYFGDADPIGKTLALDGEQDYVITGLINKVPDNSYLKFGFLASFSSLNAQNVVWLNDWMSHRIHTYFLLKKGASPETVAARFPDFIRTHIDAPYRERYRPLLQPFRDLHLHSELEAEWGETLDVAYIYIFFAIALFILLIACINFMNLATARSANRAKEVGMRKVLGAFRTQLVRQFLAESIVISFIALAFAIVLVELALPWFRSLTTREVSIHYWENQVYLFSLFGLALLVGILAGGYPAIFLSKFQPAIVLKAVFAKGTKGATLRKVLVVAQFSIAIFMIVANFLLYEQIHFLKNRDLGFDKHNVIYFYAPENNSHIRQATIKNELLKNPAIHRVFMSSSEPGDGYMMGRFLPEGSSEPDGMLNKNLAIDESYLPTLKIPLIAGRNFSAPLASDTSDAVIINETAAKQFGWENPIGKRVEWIHHDAGNKSRTVIGVVKDFHFQSLYEPIQPLILHYSPKFLSRYFIRVEPSAAAETYKFLEAQWRIYDPKNSPVSYYLDVDLMKEYDLEDIIASMLIKFTVLTVLIACLGLLGLAAFTAEQRTKEIGIRKVLGANLNSIVTLLSGEFIKLVLIANLAAWPLAYFTLNVWLQNFAYHIDIGVTAFLASGFIALLIAWITVSFFAIKAALANPVEALRYE